MADLVILTLTIIAAATGIAWAATLPRHHRTRRARPRLARIDQPHGETVRLLRRPYDWSAE